MMPVDVFIKTNRLFFDKDRKYYRFRGHQPNPLFTLDGTNYSKEAEEICPCCVDKCHLKDKPTKVSGKVASSEEQTIQVLVLVV